MKQNYKFNQPEILAIPNKPSTVQTFICVAVLMLLSIFFQTAHAQITYTFTTAGVTGVSGPSQAQVNSSYLSTNLNGLVVCTGGIQSFTVPTGVSMIRIDAYGSQGGSGGAVGGLGARMSGDFTVSPGQVLKILVGQAGQNGTYQGGGGGGSYVCVGTNTPLCIAGGGGGSYYSTNSGGAANMAGSISTTGNSGMHGLNATVNALGGSGGAGGNIGTLNTNSQGSGGGGLTGNGANGWGTTGGLSFINGGTGGLSANNSPGSAGNGGFGGGGGADWNSWTGAGGGGGYSGGGGAIYYGCGGGGGSYNSGTNQTNSAGNNSGNGKVIITHLFSLAISQTSLILCNGLSTGALSTTVTGSSGPFTYSWMPSGGTSSTTSGLAAGTYSCKVTSATTETAIAAFTITQPSALISTSSQTNVSCFGGSTGKASAVGSGGTGAYTYSWIPSGGTASLATNLAIGSYTCTIKDANNCTHTVAKTITQPSLLIPTVSQTSVLCNGGTGSASVIATGGTPGYTYLWSPSGGSGATATGLTAGNYTCTVTDANLCPSPVTLTIAQPAVLVGSISGSSVSCNGGANGSLTLTLSGGTGPYTYAWLPSSGSSSVAGNLSAGGYTTTAADSHSCSITLTATVVQPTALAATTTSANILCNGGNSGAGSINASGGTGTYTYSWSPSGGTGPLATGLIAGNYTCTILDANLCVLTKTFTLTQPTAITSTVSSLNVNCFGGANGSATVSANGGTGTLSYSWTPVNASTQNIGSLTAGIYSCTIKDANNCSVNATVAVTQPAALTASITPSNILCNGGSTGSASISATGGTSPYTYTWSSNATVAIAGSLTAGTYTCVVTDSNSCTLVSTVTLTQPAAIVSSQTVNLCAGKTLTVGTHTYSSTGVYMATLTASNGCDSTVTSNLTVYSLTAVSLNITGADSVCVDDASFNLTGGMPVNGTYTGSAVSASMFNPASALSGWNVVNYMFTDGNACVNNAADSMYVRLCTSITENNLAKHLLVYPNPTNSKIMVDLQGSGGMNLSIYSVTGQLMVIQESEGNQAVLDLKDLDAGIYLLHVKTSSGSVQTRVIKN